MEKDLHFEEYWVMFNCSYKIKQLWLFVGYLGWQMAACASATTGEEVEQIKLIVIFHGLVPVSIFWRAICFKDESAW